MPDEEARARIAELEADNRRLRLLLDQRDAPAEVRHRLRGTIALMRMIVRLSVPSAGDVESYAAHITGRIEAMARAQLLADTHGKVDLQYLVAEELLTYRILEGDLASISGPAIDLKPRVAQILAIAVHELVVNAMEHGSLGAGAGRLDIDWTIAASAGNTVVHFVWKESGGCMSPPGPPGFGSRALTEMLSYELGARTNLAYEEDGLRCAIDFVLDDRVGTLAQPAEIEIR